MKGMELDHRNGERKSTESYQADIPPLGHCQEMKIRREIANKNERRRMAGINVGFQTLRSLLPQPEYEKLSKAVILKNSAEYILMLKRENYRLQHLYNQLTSETTSSALGRPDTKHMQSGILRFAKKSTSGVKFEPIEDIQASNLDENDQAGDGSDILQKQIVDLRCQLESERTMRKTLEKKLSQNLGIPTYLSEPMSPELSGSECPEDLTTKKDDISDEVPVMSKPRFVRSPSLFVAASGLVEMANHQQPTKRRKHGLSTIIEAINCVEGEGMFQEPRPDC